MRCIAALLLIASLAQAESFVQVSSRNPRYLELSSGEPFIPIGLNLGWERFATTEEEVFAKTAFRFKQLSENKGNFARVWLSHPFYDFDQDSPSAEIEQKLRRIDRLVSIAATNKIRLKLCLEHFRTTDAMPVGFPGSVSFGRPELAKRFGSITNFFQDAKARQWYLRKLDILAVRYANQPTIAAWELWNEINAARGQGWEQWTREMLPELKRRFPRQLALQTLGSFDRESAQPLYQRFSQMPGNEIAQVHRYYDPGAPWKICQQPMDVLTAAAVASLRSYVSDRPVLISEVGAVEANHAGPSRQYENDRDGFLLHDATFAAFFAGSAGSGQFWHWQDYVEKQNLWHHFARFAEAIKGIDPREEEFQPTIVPHETLRIYLLKGKRTSLAWIRGDGTPAGISFDGRWADVYDPWKNTHQRVRVRKGRLQLPAIHHSLVVRASTK